MKKLIIPEHGRIVSWRRKTPPPEASEHIAYLEERLYNRLEKHEQHLSRNGKPVFTWYSDYLKANQWVGVVQVTGLQIEILPKVDSLSQAENRDDQWGEARRNLLYMLAVAGDLNHAYPLIRL